MILVYVAFAAATMGFFLWTAGWITVAAARTLPARRTGNALCLAGGVLAVVALVVFVVPLL